MVAKVFPRYAPLDPLPEADMDDRATWLENVIPGVAGEVIVGNGLGVAPSRVIGDTRWTTLSAAAAQLGVQGIIRDGWYEPLPLATSGSTTATAVVNSVYLYRMQVPVSGSLTQINFVAGAAGGLQAFGIYIRSGTAGTYNRAATCTPMLPTAPALNTVNLTAALPVTIGTDYFFAFGGDNATTSYLRFNLSANTPTFGEAVLAKVTSYSAGLPASISAMVAGTFVPWMAFHIV